MALLLLALGGLLAYWLWWSFVGRRRGLPPGPTPLPVLGNGLLLDPKDMRTSILRIGKQSPTLRHGPLYTFWLGDAAVVMVCDVEEARKLFVSDHADATADWSSDHPDTGLLNSSGPRWRETRRFSLHTLRDFGVGRPLSEDAVRREADKMVAFLRDLVKNSPNGDVNPAEPVNMAVINVISQLMYGQSFERGDGEVMEVRDSVQRAQDAFIAPAAMMLQGFPWLRHVPLFGHFGYDDINDSASVIWNYIEGMIGKIKKSYDPASEPNCFVEAYLREAAERRSAGMDAEPITDLNMSRTIGDFWIAGFETTVITFRWTIAYLCMHPEVQAKAREEVLAFYESKGGKDVEMGDRAALPYTSALVTEAQRLANIFPINMQRKLSKDVQVGGWELKAGTFVIPMLSNFLHDERIYPQPMELRPERFLEGDAKEQREAFLPFSLGKRACAGESLARMELFIFTVALLRHFRILQPKEGLAPSHDCLPGQTRKPTDYFVQLREISDD